MSTHIFKNNTESAEEQYFCMSGQEDYIDESGNPRISDNNNPNIAAKIIVNKKPRQVTAQSLYKSYFIKVDPALNVYNPVPLLSNIIDKKNDHFINTTCKNEWFFKEVDINIFNKYINFLKIKNVKLIKDIERDLK